MDAAGATRTASNHDVSALLSTAFPNTNDRSRGAPPDSVFDELLSRIERERRQRLEKVEWLQAHLKDARAGAAAHDRERTRAALVAYADFEKTGLPEGRSRLVELLDTQALRTHHLVLPSAAIVSRSAVDDEGAAHRTQGASSPVRPVPNYLKSTRTFSHRGTGKVFHRYKESEGLEDDEANALRERALEAVRGEDAAARAKVWEESMDPQQRTAERKVLARMNERASFLRNPRNVSGPSSMTSTSGIATSFAADPETVVFSSYAVGQVYEMPIVLRNVDSVGRRVRVLPPASTHFAVLPGRYPATSEGSVAPGMCAHYIVRFLPDSLDDFSDTLHIDVEDGTSFDIALVARREPPVLSLPEVFDLGPCLVGDTVTFTFECTNTGGEGRFSLFTAEQWDSSAVVELADGWDGMAGSFLVTPCVFALQKSESMALSAQFAPSEQGEARLSLVMVCDNCRVRRFELFGFADAPRLSCEGGLDSPTEAAVGRILFGDQHPLVEQSRSVAVKNDTTVDVPFSWECESTDGMFSIDPSCGIFGASSCTNFTVRFNPRELGYWTDRLHLVLTELPPSLQWAARCLPLEVEGMARPIVASLRPPALALSREVCVGETVARVIHVCNNSQSPARFCWRGVTEDGDYAMLTPEEGVVWAFPEEGIVPPTESVQIEVFVRPSRAGPFCESAVCVVENAQPLVLHIEGRAMPPALSVIAGDVDFGLVAMGTFVPRLVTVSNTSPVPTPWTASIWDPFHSDHSDHIAFSPSEGVLAAGESVNVRVTLHPRIAGPVAETLCFIPDGGNSCLLPCHAEVVAPSVCVLPSKMRLEEAYVGVSVTRTVVMRNLTLLPTPFAWEELSSNVNLRATFNPQSGVLDPGQELIVDVSLVAVQTGLLSGALLACSIADGAHYAGLSVDVDVRGLSVSYRSSEGRSLEDNRIDFGLECPIGESRTRTFEIVNHSAISAPFAVFVERYASRRHRPVSGSHVSESPRPGGDGGLALVRTTTGTDKRALALASGNGVAFEVTPAEGWLAPFSTTVVKVEACNDMWGIYEDRVRCDVGGLEPAHLGLRIGVIGSPLHFRATSTGLCMSTNPPSINFGSQPFGEKEVPRMFRVENSSPFDIELDWQVVTRENSEKEKLVDFRVCVDGNGRVAVAVHNHDGAVTENTPFRVTSGERMIVPAKGSAPVHLTFQSAVPGYFSSMLASFMRVPSSATEKNGPWRAQGELTWPLRMALVAHSSEPSLTVDAGRVVRFKCQSADLSPKGRLVVRRTVGIANGLDSPLAFILTTAGPFCVAATECLAAAQLPGRKNAFVLQPKDNMGVTLEFAAEVSMLTKGDRSSDAVLCGSLVIVFSNGSQQVVELEGLISRPRVTLSSVSYDFGTVLVRDSRAFSLEITNVSACEAPFECELVGDGVFSIVGPAEGSLANPAVTRERPRTEGQVAHASAVSIRFAPREPRRYNGLIRVLVEHGGSHEVRLSGFGSVDERMYNADRL
eukprot:Opistho-2@25245